MAKLDKDFVLIDESVVRNGFRVKMSGAELDEFKANPVMLFMHNRATAGWTAADNDVMLPIGKWYDIRVEGDKLLAKPDFDDSDEFAIKIEKKVKGGYLNAASIWIDPVATDDDESLKKPGQRGPTVTKWGILECSIVDIPNCRGALGIKNSAGKKIALSGAESDAEILNYLLTLSTNTTMDKKLLCLALGLPETASDAEISAKLTALNTTAQTLLTVTTERDNLKTQLDAANLKLNAQETKDKEKKVADLVEGAIKEGKLLAGDKDRYMKLATADYETTEAVIKEMKPHTSLSNLLNTGGSGNAADDAELMELLKLSGRDLYMQGKMPRLQALSVEHFKLKYKEYFGADWKA